MKLSDEIKAAIGGDGKSRHQTRCLYEQWAYRVGELEAALVKANSGAAYQAGKQDGIKAGWNDPRKDPVFLAHCAFITAIVRHESAKLGSRLK